MSPSGVLTTPDDGGAANTVDSADAKQAMNRTHERSNEGLMAMQIPGDAERGC
jgi:hypothetical protein